MGALRSGASGCLLLALMGACASVPATRYGVRRVRFEGVRAFDPDGIRSCLSIQERDAFDINLDVFEPDSCGTPPFEGDAPRLRLFTLGWTDWQFFDRIALEQDVERIRRWYAARGHHSARVVSVRVDPEQAASDDTLPESEPEPGCERLSDDEGCEVDVVFEIDEGEPTHVERLELFGLEELDEDLRTALEAVIQVKEGERWDEAFYDASKTELVRVMATAGYARAEVKGVVRIDRPNQSAWVRMLVSPGPICEFGQVRVVGNEDLPMEPIIGAAFIPTGTRYDAEELLEAQRAVFSLGAFAGVSVEPILPETGNIVDVRVRVNPARRQRYGIGAGVQSGVSQRGRFDDLIPVRQWDVHLSLVYEHRNLFGGLRRLLLKDQPKLIFGDVFPSLTRPRFGNTISAEFRQPGFIDPRTTLVVDARHEFGPDPYDTFFRHRLDIGLELERWFWHQRIFVSAGLPRAVVYRVPDGEETERATDVLPTDYQVTYLHQLVRLDLRDSATRPHAGFYAQVDLQEAFLVPNSWDYFRIVPDVRVYIPLPRRITIAARFSLGMLFLRSADPSLDLPSQLLGPRDFRFFGGGSTDNRGYLPGRLGDGRTGGTRKWLASLELRVPVTEDFGVVAFGDAGDVDGGDLIDGPERVEARFRFDVPQMTVGLGLRYYTVVGAIRLDIGYAIPGLQYLGDTDPRRQRAFADDTEVSLGFFRFPGAVHIALGESF